ncbi:IS21 family transposase [Brevibacillus humidisoli]|uniref:IS21 family transposase n=1 Tax=Brevibacillus composti TaxID=2796470 RepID=A0A7T5ELY7_9BACL|nr:MULTISPECIES: IS21 family transposase [Brevibacillus]EJL45577.1 transposase [Brevibacillus sp. CF112]QQE73202.1 IS21 family transposase [Brevibacillus composti]QQE75056.1 IS21 family transposase [Brevibacillus composti]QUO40283.1 IS21 family transposase [Brevibacillus composti]QUO42142.1 IS21 family transposase [Brevibacillus composti]
MLAMAEVNYIRHETNTKGRSYSSVARQMNMDRRTIKKYSEMEDFNQEVKSVQTRKANVMDPVKPIVDQWLLEDMGKKKKFRRTAKRIYTLLVSEHGFQGSDRTIRAYVAKRKAALLDESNDTALPLEAKAGTAQVDFGEAPFKHRGKEVILPFLVLSFPYSNSFLFQVFPSQNRECFLQGLTNMFAFLEGVPHTIRFDNLSPAVKKVLPNGERQVTEEFARFVAHYGFQYEFCNPGSGNEKGHVEAMVKYIRNNYLLPEIHYEDLSVLNEKTLNWSLGDRKRCHYEKDTLIAELYLEDKERFLQLPGKAYECVRFEQVKADKYGIVRIDQKQYSTSPRFAGQAVLAKISFDTISLLNEENEVIVRHPRLYGETKKSMDWQPYLTLMAKRPTALKYSSFYDQLPEEWKAFFGECTVEEKRNALQLLSVILKEQDFDISLQALRIASEHGHPTTESIKHVYYQLVNGRGIRETLSLPPSVPSTRNSSRGLSHYDRLMIMPGGEQR